MRLQTRSPGVESEPVRVFLTEHAAGMSDSRHWLHRGTYWIYHAAGTDLSVSLPRGAVFSRATLDGVETPAAATQRWTAVAAPHREYRHAQPMSVLALS